MKSEKSHQWLKNEKISHVFENRENESQCKLFCASAFDFTARLAERDCCTSPFVWISVNETVSGKQNINAYMTEHRLMHQYMKHIEDTHIKTNV